MNYDVLRGHSRNTSIVQKRAKLNKTWRKKWNKNCLNLITRFLCPFNDVFKPNTHIQLVPLCIENMNIITRHISINRKIIAWISLIFQELQKETLLVIINSIVLSYNNVFFFNCNTRYAIIIRVRFSNV